MKVKCPERSTVIIDYLGFGSKNLNKLDLDFFAIGWSASSKLERLL